MTGSPSADEAPRFAELWQAEAFATVVVLNRKGVFAWAEWVDALAREVAQAPQRKTESSETAYYRQWLAALERILAEKGVTTTTEIAAIAEDWRRSYLHTPHGRPVHLQRDLPDLTPVHAEDHDHDHKVAPRPVAIDLASE